MSDEDRSLFGEGPYPPRGPLAVLARLGLVGASLAVMVATFLPPEMVPRVFWSNYLEHFAAFYVLTIFALAALPGTQLRRIGLGVFLFATVLELTHLPAGAPIAPLVDNWVANLGGLAAALAPLVVERFRRRVRLASR